MALAALRRMGVLRFSVQFVLGIVLPLVIELWDRRRLSPDERARAWNGASWASALYAFGEMSLLGWFWVTRRWRGVPRGIAWSLAVFVVLRLGVDRAIVALAALPDRTTVVEVLAGYAVLLAVAMVPWSVALFWERRARRVADLGASPRVSAPRARAPRRAPTSPA